MGQTTQPLTIHLNGKPRIIENAVDPSQMDILLLILELKTDRIAVELNGDIVRRTVWADTLVRTGDRLEIVHFVGGGLG